MNKIKLLKLWNRYYIINTFAAVAPITALALFLYLSICDILSWFFSLLIMFTILCVSLITLIITTEKQRKISTDKANLNAFLAIAVNDFRGGIFYNKNGKRKINKQMTFVSNLKGLLYNVNYTDNENRKELYNFICNDYYLKNEDEFIQLCRNCLNAKKNQQVPINEDIIDKTSTFKLVASFVKLQIKIGILCAMIVALFMALFLAFCELLSKELPFATDLFSFLAARKGAIYTSNTIVFDVAAIILLILEIKQEDI